MKLHFDIYLNNSRRNVLLCSRKDETPEHAALRMSAMLTLWRFEPVLEPPRSIPAMQNVDMQADVAAIGAMGEISCWAECGYTEVPRLSKLVKRLPPEARFVLLTDSLDSGEKTRAKLRKDLRHHERVTILSWREEQFARWNEAMRDDNFIMGEGADASLNLVFNDIPFAINLTAF
jgi:hypothetical protein